MPIFSSINDDTIQVRRGRWIYAITSLKAIHNG